jgi:hypothetical protein
MSLSQPFQYERRIVGASVVDECQRDIRGSIQKIAECVRLKPRRLIETGDDDHDLIAPGM